MKNNQTLIFFFTLTLVAGLCLAVGLAAWGVSELPGWASSQFGNPNPDLEPLQRLILSAKLLNRLEDLKLPKDPDGAEKTFQVQLGESPLDITNRLEQEGLIMNAQALRDYLIFAGLDTSIQAGEFVLNPRMNSLEIANALQDATPDEVTFVILPGWRMEEVAAVLPTSGLSISPQAFLDAVKNPLPDSPIRAEVPKGASLEGFLFPDSYRLKRDIRTQAFIDILTENFRAAITEDLRQGFARQGLDIFQTVVLASIVQREAVVPEEMPMIASVFLNRLAAGMKLDADPTVQYALGFNYDQNTWWTNPLSKTDLEVNSPYNTYLNWGLPPGPIANPGLNALQAVAYPAQTPYYYFRAACDGSGRHSFAENFEQHLENACP